MVDVRSLPEGLSAIEQCNERLSRLRKELQIPLGNVDVQEHQLGAANENNCEQMFGHVSLPVGYAGPLPVHTDSAEELEVHLPLATTEAALVASINRGCKALRASGGVTTTSERIGITRSMAFRTTKEGVPALEDWIHKTENDWKIVGEQTSNHLTVLSWTIDIADDHLFLTIACDTDQAMGMNMVTIAAQNIGQYIVEQFPSTIEFVTVAGNVDSDKKPSKRTHDNARGFKVEAKATISVEALNNVLKIEAKDMAAVAQAKLLHGSSIAGALGTNLHAANTIAALYLALGQDAAHVVEGSLTDTFVATTESELEISVRLPAILVGIRGGGTGLPAQSELLQMLLQPECSLHPCHQLAQSIGAAVLAGELSLLAAQASHTLAKAHRELAR